VKGINRLAGHKSAPIARGKLSELSATKTFVILSLTVCLEASTTVKREMCSEAWPNINSNPAIWSNE
jgi:hypothetical protein